MLLPLWIIVVLFSMFIIFSLLFGIWKLISDKKRNLFHLPGPIPVPLLGNALLFPKSDEFVLTLFQELANRYGPVFRFHVGIDPQVIVSSPDAIETVLNSSVDLRKAPNYKFTWPWIGTGLLTSSGTKWQIRRKMLASAFHFKILEDFQLVMNSQASILCDQVLYPLCGSGEVNIFPLIAHCALDIICETAMGCSFGAQLVTDNKYVQAVHEATEVVAKRSRSPWIWDDFLFSLSPSGTKMKRALSVLHGFTDRIIKKRMKDQDIGIEYQDDKDDTGIKRKLAFLDLLVSLSKGGTVFSTDDIREEVDTFMFAGHDSTGGNTAFTIWSLASDQRAQTECHKEIDRIFEGNKERPITCQDLAKMTFLEACIKESLRLYPGVPIIGRTLSQDLELDGFTVPSKTTVFMMLFLLHRDPKIFSNPDQFIPERFLNQIHEKRHPYGYIPFSYGARNCIGQKFAMMEEKVVISSILRRYNLSTTLEAKSIPLVASVTLRPKNGLSVSFTERFD